MLQLVLHPTETRTPKHHVRASARRVVGSGLVTVRFEVEGSREIVWPKDSGSPTGERLDELWKQTCLECFVGSSAQLGGTAYREWNFSPSGDWAAYTFTKYREGMAKPDVAGPYVERILVGEKTRFEIAFEFNEVAAAGVTRVGLTAVMIQKGEAHPFYWALAHAGAKPDFHLHESFTLELES